MLARVSIAALGLTLICGSAHAQLLGNVLSNGANLPSAIPTSPSNNIQEGLAVGVGPTAQGNLAVGLVSGQQLPVPVNATVSPDGTGPKGGPSVYLRLPKDAAGAPQGVDLRVSLLRQDGSAAFHQGVQLGKQ